MAWTTATTRASGFLITAAVWNAEHVDNMNFLRRVAYQEFTAGASITGTTEGTANQVVSAGAITFEAVPHLLEFWCPALVAPAATMNVIFRDSTTVLGRIASLAASEVHRPAYGMHCFTPTAAAHTYNVAAHVGSGTGTISAGAGGAATLLPGFIRITRVPT